MYSKVGYLGHNICRTDASCQYPIYFLCAHPSPRPNIKAAISSSITRKPARGIWRCRGLEICLSVVAFEVGAVSTWPMVWSSLVSALLFLKIKMSRREKFKNSRTYSRLMLGLRLHSLLFPSVVFQYVFPFACLHSLFKKQFLRKC